MAKRGRKRKNDLYFGPEEEEAVRKFISLGEMVYHPICPVEGHNCAKDCEEVECTKNPLMWVGTIEEEIERNAIYNKWLRKPLHKMVESIIRKYGLYRKGESYEHTHMTALSFLMTKAHKFKSDKGKKAYSYYGTICRRHVLGLIINDEKETNRSTSASYEDIVPYLEQKDDFKYELPDHEFNFDKLIKNVIKSIEEELEGKNLVGKKKLTENEIKVGYGLIDMLNNWEITLDSMAGGKKFNKNIFYENMRRYTNLNTKDIRLSMDRYKILYDIIKINGLEYGIQDEDVEDY
jgi:hypothetical protein